jgi:lipoate-protein ligase A
MEKRMMVTELRFYDMEPARGSLNMAIDEALAETLMGSMSYAYLRFYRWQPSCLSFGYNQQVKEQVNLDMVRALGLGAVRRASGGKMVFHAEEITFSLGLPVVLVRSVLGPGATFIEMFHLAMQPILDALKKLGVPARFSSDLEVARGAVNPVHCYGSAAGHSIFAGEKKLIGAAGFYRRGCLIVHGSIPIHLSVPPSEVFYKPDEACVEVEMASLSEFIEQDKMLELPQRVGEHFAQALHLPLKVCALTQGEMNYSQKIKEEKYENEAWLRRK